MKINIEIDNITEPQKIAIEDMMSTWIQLGNLGCSRWTAFFADGDGNFRPKIKIDGNDPKFTKLMDRDIFWKNIKIADGNLKDNKHKKELKWYDEQSYMMDFDAIAWVLTDNN